MLWTMLLISSLGAYAQPKPPFLQVTAQLRSDIALLVRREDLTMPEKHALAEADASIAFLRAEWSVESNVSHAYLSSVLNDDRVINAARKYSAERRLHAIRFVRDDVGVKAENCRVNRANGGTGLGKDVKVAVTTKLAGSTVGGYDIAWTWAFLVDTEKPIMLNTQSSPAIGTVPPGLILFWARKANVDMPNSRKTLRAVARAAAFDLPVYR